jgi:short subunit dehydrogenase-like uncharacterized protein
MTRWLLYGAYGYTGQLIIDEAKRRGHRPVLAGRNAAKLATLGARHDLDWLALDLDYADRLNKTVDRYDLVLHAAGPFIHTSDPMIRACLAGRTHYLDITGEIGVFENTFRYDAQAQARGVCLMSGVGFDIVPTDCLARYLVEHLPEATHLETAVSSPSQLSSGTLKSALSMLDTSPAGSAVRRDGRLVQTRLGQVSRDVVFSNGRRRHVVSFPWGDLVTAYHTTGVPNITCYLSFPRLPAQGVATRLGVGLLNRGPVRRLAETTVSRATGPDEETRRTARSYLWACASDASGRSREAWMETAETYYFTALAAVRAVEKVLKLKPSGAHTPAGAFGADFALELEGTKRFDALPVQAR